MTDHGTSTSWVEYRRLVLAALERYEEQIDALKTENGDLASRLTQVERLSGALRTAVFGDGSGQSMATQIALLQKFMNEHPSLTHETTETGEKKVDKKMLFLLAGAISGLIGLLKIALEIIQKVVGG